MPLVGGFFFPPLEVWVYLVDEVKVFNIGQDTLCYWSGNYTVE